MGLLDRILGRNAKQEIIEAADGPEAVKAVEQDPLDLILLDIRMTMMDGIESARV